MPLADAISTARSFVEAVYYVYLLLILVTGMLLRSRRLPVVSGREQLVGAAGEALEDLQGEGWARVHGERWRVRCAVPVKRGERLRVTAIDGLVLDTVPDSRNA